MTRIVAEMQRPSRLASRLSVETRFLGILKSLPNDQWQALTIEEIGGILMIAGTRSSLLAYLLVCAFVAGWSEANGQPPTEQFSYPSTGFPPWTPSSGIRPFPANRNPTTDRLLLDASDSLQREGRDSDAIAVLNIVLADKRKPPNPLYASNSQHDACVRLSDIYERQGKVSKALEFAVLARDKHPYSEMCGLMVMSVRGEVDERIASLTEQLHRGATEALAGRTESRTPSENRTSVRR